MSAILSFLLLLITANAFMTMAWYGHLKNTRQPLLFAILASWMIAFVEYCFQVPANRIGSRHFSLTQLKITQECVTLTVFLVYAYLVFRETPRWNTLASMACIVGAVTFAFLGAPAPRSSESPSLVETTAVPASMSLQDLDDGQAVGAEPSPRYPLPSLSSQLEEGTAP